MPGLIFSKLNAFFEKYVAMLKYRLRRQPNILKNQKVITTLSYFFVEKKNS